ncbi:30S ribosomal protein S6 [candidate division WOR-3 bacterium]|nr:30S ribosomal protein S6 [candidate division WOR-3 bacterium]
MNKYENLLIIDARIGDEKLREILEDIKDYVSKNQGEVLSQKEAGKKELVVKNNKKIQSSYIFNIFKSSPSFIEGYRRYLNMKPEILRHFVVRVEEPEKEKANA